MKVILVVIISYLLFNRVFAQEVIFEHLYDPGDFDGRIIRTTNEKKLICLKSGDSLIIFNISTKKITKKFIHEIDSNIVGGNAINDTPFVGVIEKRENGVMKSIFVIEKDDKKYQKIEFPINNWLSGFYYRMEGNDRIVIIGGYNTLTKYIIDLKEEKIIEMKTITKDSGGYFYIFGGQVVDENGNKIMIFNYPYLTSTRVLILINDSLIKKRDDPVIDVALLGKRKYTIISSANSLETVIYDIYDTTFRNNISGTWAFATGSDEWVIKINWGYNTIIKNLKENLEYYVTYNKIWVLYDAVIDVIHNDTCIIIIGRYEDKDPGKYGIVVMKQKLLTPISVVESESKNKNEREKIKVEKVGSNTFEISNLEENDRIVLYDILGRKVKEVEGSSRIILNNVSSGVYFLVVKRRDYIVFREKVYIVK